MKYKFIYSYCCTVVMTLNCLVPLQAENAVKTPSSLNCTKEQLMTFFPQPIVESVLTEAKISEEQVKEISQELSQQDRELIKKVEEKAAKWDPNPFSDLSQRDLAIKIYNETLYEVFSKILKAHGINSDNQIQALLDKVREMKSKLFIDCIRNQQISSTPPTPTATP